MHKLYCAYLIFPILEAKYLEKIRKASAAGKFYDAGKNQLEESIKNCFLDKRGPKQIANKEKTDKKIIGAVVPHAGYIYSGAIAAHSYNKIKKSGFADTFIILGPNHTGIGSAVSTMTKGKWETPLGQIKINKEISKKIKKDIIDDDENAHSYEHSIEVQIPFLQYISNKEEFDFVPISMSMQDNETSKEIGEIIANVIKNSNNNVIIIASSDFSHVGFNYQSMPPEGMQVDEYAEKQDTLAIEKILNLDPQGLINTVYEKNITMCGYGPIASMLYASKILGAKKAELLKYGTSYEVHPGSSCVGYGSIVVY